MNWVSQHVQEWPELTNCGVVALMHVHTAQYTITPTSLYLSLERLHSQIHRVCIDINSQDASLEKTWIGIDGSE